MNEKNALYLRITIIIIFLVSYNATVLSQNLMEVKVDVMGIESSKGKLIIAVFSSEERFLVKPESYVYVKSPKQGKDTASLMLPAGKYAFSIFHDENDNEELDKTWIGLPKEKYGFSNDASGWMGPPAFDACIVDVESNKRIEIHLK